jgi:hypothetical protein
LAAQVWLFKFGTSSFIFEGPAATKGDAGAIVIGPSAASETTDAAGLALPLRRFAVPVGGQIANYNSQRFRRRTHWTPMETGG